MEEVKTNGQSATRHRGLSSGTMIADDGDEPPRILRALPIAPERGNGFSRGRSSGSAEIESAAVLHHPCETKLDGAEQRDLSLAGRPALARRALATLVDRLAPLPFIAYLFPAWSVVVVAYHLLCDGTPAGRSAGKRLMRLRVVSVAQRSPCGVARSVVRRLVPALCQLAYCSWEFVWLALIYELASLAFVMLDRQGRRLEDYAAGTRVITERAFKRSRRAAEERSEDEFQPRPLWRRLLNGRPEGRRV